MLLPDELIGKKFGLLTIIGSSSERTKDRKTKVFCKCDCGVEKLVILTCLNQGKIKSCGFCTKADKARANGRLSIQIMIDRGLWAKEASIGTAKGIYDRTYADGDISFEKFLELSQLNCYYCDSPPSNYSNKYRYRKKKNYSAHSRKYGFFRYNGLDRVDNNRGHTLDNVVTSCAFCNKSKSNRSQQDFFDWIKKVYSKLNNNSSLVEGAPIGAEHST